MPPTTRSSHAQELSYALTAADDRFPQWGVDRTRISNAERTERDAGRRRAEAVEWHDQTLKSLLNHTIEQKSRCDLASLLNELSAGRGLGWSEIARLVGVSVPAVRKWRNGGDITSPRLKNLAQLAAFLQILEDSSIPDPAAWLAVPIDDDESSSEIAKVDIYVDGGPTGVIALLAFAKNRIRRDELLAQLPSGGRVRLQNVVGLAPDGNLSITPAADR